MTRDEIKQYIKDEVFKLCQEMYELKLADADDIATPIDKRPYDDRSFSIECDIVWRLQDFESVSYEDESEWDLNFDDYNI